MSDISEKKPDDNSQISDNSGVQFGYRHCIIFIYCLFNDAVGSSGNIA
jgi:hypothetical protein